MKKIILMLILLVNGYAEQPYWWGLDGTNQNYLTGKGVADNRFEAYANSLVEIEQQLGVKISTETSSENIDGITSEFLGTNIEEGAIYKASKGKIELYFEHSEIKESFGNKTGRERYVVVGLTYMEGSEEGMCTIDYEGEWGETEGLGDGEQYGKNSCVTAMNCSIIDFIETLKNEGFTIKEEYLDGMHYVHLGIDVNYFNTENLKGEENEK